MAELVNGLKEEQTIQGVGISAPGITQKDGMMTTAGAIYSLYGTNLKEEMEARCQVPVIIENDANAVAIAERWLGNATSFDHYICLVLGTGVGGGIVINGQVYRGARGIAGEFGLAVVANIPDSGVEDASLNKRAAVVGGLCRLYNEAVVANRSEFEQTMDARVIFERETVDPIAKEIIAQFYQDLAVGLLNLAANFDPEAILIGGGISNSDAFIKRLKQEATTLEEKHDSIRGIKKYGWAPILPAKLTNNAGIVGAVYPFVQK